MQVTKQKDAYKLLHNGIQALARAERQGIRIDLEYAQQKKEELTELIAGLEDEFKQTKFYKHWEHTKKGKVNINSNPQLSHFLYKVKKLKPAKKTASGQGSTDEEALEALGIPELNNMLRIRKLRKIRDTYLEGFIKETVNGYLHPFFNLHTVRSYRSSSDSPNFQNIPIRDEESKALIRKAMKPRPGHRLLEIDYSGLEFNINACYSQDPAMVEYCKDPTSDIHGDMAAELFMIDDFNKSIPHHKRLRSAAKNGFVFPELYGDYYKNCAINLACNWGKLPDGRWSKGQGIEYGDVNLSDHLISKGLKSLSQYTDYVKEVEDKFFNKFSKHARYMKNTMSKYQREGYVELYTGFRCSGEMTKNMVLNYPIQGSAFHCLLWSFIELDRLMVKEGWRTRLVGQIHDSIILDAHPDELDYVLKTVRRVTCEDLLRAWPWIIVPLDIEAEICEVDESWYHKKEIKI